MNMKEELVSFKIAKLAKTYLFNEVCIDTYNEVGVLQERYDVDICEINTTKDIKKEFELTNIELDEIGLKNSWQAFVAAPTQSLLQRWLREKHNLFIEVCLHGDKNDNWNVSSKKIRFGVSVDYYGENFEAPMTGEEDYGEMDFKSYEKALEIGLLKGLKLIKL